VWKEKDGKEYCVFHAPVERKREGLAEFQRRITKRIDDVKNAGANKDMCRFSGAIFPDRVVLSRHRKDDTLPAISFRGAIFGAWAYFGEATFGERAVFDNATFGVGVSFSGSTFGALTGFFDATIGEGADFSKATFGKETVFFRDHVW